MADRKGQKAKETDQRKKEPHWVNTLIKAVPWHKLRRYEVTNIAWSLLALYFTVQFALHQSSLLYPSILLGVVVAATLGCVLWACKQ
ncbi:MAG TPA: hypothetical protein VLV49_15545 [Terriglobales bacterium]|nr:hypothetical protein [Terriglobales bacterium]